MLGIGTEALQQATQLAMRDAGARLATELREQAIVRGLLRQTRGARDRRSGRAALSVRCPGAAAGSGARWRRVFDLGQ